MDGNGKFQEYSDGKQNAEEIEKRKYYLRDSTGEVEVIDLPYDPFSLSKEIRNKANDTLPGVIARLEDSEMFRFHPDFYNILSEANTKVAAVEALAEQSEGLKTKEAYIHAMLAGNDQVRNIDVPNFEKNALYFMLYGHNGELPINTHLVSCADGRSTGPTPFAKEPLVKFTSNWRPQAGVIFSGELWGINKSENPAQELKTLLANPERKQELFTSLDTMLSRSIGSLRRKAKASTLAARKVVLGEIYPTNTDPDVADLADRLIELSGESIGDAQEWAKISGRPEDGYASFKAKIEKLTDAYPTVIELQSHAHPHDEHHGCGAHGCDDHQALQMTAINAIVLREWITERFPEENIHIVRTHHLTGKDERVVSSATPHYMKGINPELSEMFVDKEKSTVSGHTEFQFQPLYYKKADDTHHIVRLKKLESGVDVENHDEYIIHISPYQMSMDLRGTSLLKQSPTADIALNEGVVKKLISIARNHRIKKDAEKGIKQPIFLHLNAPLASGEDNKRKAELFDELFSRLQYDPEIRSMIESGEIIIVKSVTRGHFFRNREKGKSLRMTFINDDQSFVMSDTEKQRLETEEDKKREIKEA